MGTVLTATQPESQPESRRTHRAVLLVLFLALFVGTLDNQIMGPYLPILAKYFNTNAGDFGRVVTIYSICAALAALMTGFAADLHGQSLFLKIAILLFAIAELTISHAQSIQSFIILRGVTGLAAV